MSKSSVNAHSGKHPLKALVAPFYGWTLRHLMRIAKKKLVSGRLILLLPSGERLIADSGNPGPQATLEFKDYHAFWLIACNSNIGLSEAYMSGLIDTEDIKNTLDLALANREWFDESAKGISGLSIVLQYFDRQRHQQNDNSKQGSRKNIYAHYDLGNDFYSEWLDKSMTYSSAIYADLSAPDETLFKAQQNKYRRIAEIGDIKPASHVLEIGCGWGGFAEFAAKEIGCKVTGVTISQAQYDYAAKRIQKAGLNEKVKLRIQDYRDIEHGAFDRIASIEMFEAVGERHWPRFFQKVKDALKPGGRASMQIITIANDRFGDYRSKVDFIQKYIFPGGMLPSIAKLQEISRVQGMKIVKNDGFALHYARTLLEWNEKFQKKWNYLSTLPGRRLDEKFRRMWEYYLKYCASGFEGGALDVRQIAWARD